MLSEQARGALRHPPLRHREDRADREHEDQPRDHDRERELVADLEGAHQWQRRSYQSSPRAPSGALSALLAPLFVALLVALFGSLVAPSRARAAEPERVLVRARVDRARGRVRGAMRLYARVGEGEEGLRLWVYADRLAVAPSAMEERSWRWVYPGEVSLGEAGVGGLTVEGRAVEGRWIRREVGDPRGRDRAGADLFVPLPAGPARTVRVELRFWLRVPDRFGRLGRAHDVLSLAAPWYPILVGEGDAFAFEAEHRVEVELLEEGEMLYLGDRLARGRARARARGPYVPLLVAPRLYQERVRVAGSELLLVSFQPYYQPPPASAPGEEGLADLVLLPKVERFREVAEQVLVSAREVGVPRPAQIPIVEVPSRTELTATAPGWVLASDRLFEIFPLDVVQEFHLRALRGALFRHLATPLARGADEVRDRPLGADLRAVALLGLDETRRHNRTQSPQELLSLVAFHPAVDQLLYAPQIAFEDAYFAAIQERDRFGDDPAFSRAPISRGRRLLESARDLLEEEALARYVRLLLRGRLSMREALRRAAPAHAARIDDWIRAPEEPLNYRLGAYSSEPAPGGGYLHRVEVIREGAPRREPVEVLVVDAEGQEVRAVWDEAGARAELTLESGAPLASVSIDPRQRLPQSPEVADGHPRMDDTTDLGWRPPILNAFLIDVFVSEGLFTGVIDFALRRRYDLEHSIGLRLERTAARTGGALSYSHGLGPKVHTNRRVGYLRAGLAFDYLHPEFAETGMAGYRLSLSLSGGIDTRRYALDPRTGYALSGGITGGGTLREDGSLGGSLRGSFRGSITVPLGLLNALVLVGGGGFSFGDTLDSELTGLGGRYLLRGYEAGELLSRGNLYLVAEHRFTAFPDLAWNILHLVWVRELQLAVFAGIGGAFDTAARCRDAALPQCPGQDALFAAEVGGGIRVHYEYGGVQPGLIAIDLSLPLVRDQAFLYSGDGTALRGRNPVGFYLSFDQYF